MNFLNTWAFLGLLSIPAILAMYLLKQKYKDLEVPSLFLWSEALEQTQSHKPWQKLKRNLLMLLQIIVATILVFALTNPYLKSKLTIKNYIIVIDQSMSMQATDESPNRFEVAKIKVKKLVEEAEPNTKISIIGMSTQPAIIMNQSSDKLTIMNKLNALQVTNATVDFESTKNLIQIIEQQTKGMTYIFSDTNYDLGNLPYQNILIGKSSANTAITLLSSVIENDRIISLVKVKNFGTLPVEQSVSLYCDDAIYDTKEITIKEMSEQDIFFTSVPRQTKVLTAKIENQDTLQIDDIAYSTITEEKKEKVLLISEQNVFLENMLSLLPNVELYKASKDNMDKLEGYYLYIFDGVLPEKMPTDGHLLVFNPPEGNQFIETNADVEIGNISVENSNLLQFMNDLNFAVAKTKMIKKPVFANIIINSDKSPLVLSGEIKNQKVVIFGFDLHNTDLPLKKEFPIFIYNLINYFIPNSISNIEKLTSGDLVNFNISAESETVRVITPSGVIIKLAPPFPVPPYYDTNEIGVYTLEQKSTNGEYYNNFAVNADTKNESNLLRDDDSNTTNNVQNTGILSNKTLKNIILVILLLFIILEWWVYNRESSI